MGSCTSRGEERNRLAQGHLAPRSAAAIRRDEGAKVDLLLRHLCTLLPPLIEIAAERHRMLQNDLQCKRGALQGLFNTLRAILRNFSEQCTGKLRFKRTLQPVEAMHVLNEFFHSQRFEALQISGEPESEVRNRLLPRFDQVYTEHLECMQRGEIYAKGIYWWDVVDRTVLFMLADKDAGGTLGYAEVQGIMHEKSIGLLSGELLRRYMKEANHSKDGKEELDYRDFLGLYERLTYSRYIRRHLFRKYANSSQRMSEDDFLRFLRDAQKDPRAADTVDSEVLEQRQVFFDRLVHRHMASYDQDGKLQMSDSGFQAFMTSLPLSRTKEGVKDSHNSALDPRKVTQVYHDMEQPMTDYFIAASHNTYLFGHQLFGQSDTAAYENALSLGCKCLELDVWDGPGGQPVVTHGYTATSEVSFESCIAKIAEHAFKVSPYPVILSLEVHTSVGQQRRMGEIMRRHFNAAVRGPGKAPTLAAFSRPRGVHPAIAYTTHSRQDVSFTPDGLKGFILCKGKMLGRRDPGFDLQVQAAGGLYRELGMAAPGTQDGQEDDDAQEEMESPGGMGAEQMAELSDEVRQQLAVRRARSFRRREDLKKNDEGFRVHPVLGSCVWMRSAPYRKWSPAAAKQVCHWDSCSLSEGRINSIWAEGKPDSSAGLVRLNQLRFTKVYPAGNRIDSDNYHPQRSWNLGCQLAALNYQLMYNRSGELRYNLGKFQDNGGSGYLLKPDYLRNGQTGDAFSDPCTLTVEVIQAFNLPKPKNAKGQDCVAGNRINPCVSLWVSGAGGDGQSIPAPADRMYTKVVRDNGFTPELYEVSTRVPEPESAPGGRRKSSVFELSPPKVNQRPGNLFRWEIESKAMAVLTVRLSDHEDGDPESDARIVAEQCVPLSVLRQGYRALPLRDESQYTTIPGALLFIRVDITDRAA
eukprot:TRINITY_DN34070_c0_g1_i1.p1 TRINITY_DN34070_c0_g1~~TRINITY_DN34070_c0_g1_i1.p1  ORF type:complete len:945 (+),score=224.16 TRINITY_DN34070_c0_g1_i1:76-2835(+)